MLSIILWQRYTGGAALISTPCWSLATHVLKERADVGRHEQHVSVHFHVQRCPASVLANRQLEGNSAASPDDARLGPARKRRLPWEEAQERLNAGEGGGGRGGGGRFATISAPSTTTCSVRRERRSWPNFGL